MKSFSFMSGSAADPSRGMNLVIDRSRIPTQMSLGLWLDDDGKAFPALPRTRPAGAAEGAEIVFVEATQLRLKIGGIEGIASVAPGTRFEVASRPSLGDVQVKGATVTTRGSRRFAQVTAAKAEFAIDKQPNAVHVFTIDAEKPAGAKPGDTFRVDVAQKDTSGNVVGGLSVVFAFG